MGFLSSMFAGKFAISGPDHWLTGAISVRTHAGTHITEQNSLKLSVVYACVGIISDPLAFLPVEVVQSVGERKKKQPGHIATTLLAKQPNPFMTAFTLRNTLSAHTLLWGNGIAEIQRDQGGKPIALWPFLPDRTRVVRNGKTITYETIIDGEVFTVQPENIFHVMALSPDGIEGFSPVTMMRQAIGLGIALEEFGAKFFGNDMQSGGFLHHPGRLSEQAWDRLKEQKQRDGGLTNAHRMKLLEEGMTFTPTTIPPEDAQFLKTREFQVEEIARYYRIPLFMVQSQSKDTSWGTGIAQQSLGFVRYTLMPWLVRWEQEAERKLLTDKERDDGFHLKHNVNGLLRPDAEGRSKFYTAALSQQTGWMNRQEVREQEDLNPDDGPFTFDVTPGTQVDNNPGAD